MGVTRKLCQMCHRVQTCRVSGFRTQHATCISLPWFSPKMPLGWRLVDTPPKLCWQKNDKKHRNCQKQQIAGVNEKKLTCQISGHRWLHEVVMIGIGRLLNRRGTATLTLRQRTTNKISTTILGIILIKKICEFTRGDRKTGGQCLR